MIQFFTNIISGKISNPKTVRAAFESLENGRFAVTIKPYKTRSNKQNRYWWGCLVPMVRDGLRDAGYNEVRTDEDAHRILKHLFLKKAVVNQKTDEVIMIEGTTTELSTTEFNELIDNAIMWAAQYLNIVIEYPNEQVELFK